jgi:hypothetical protein
MRIVINGAGIAGPCLAGHLPSSELARRHQLPFLVHLVDPIEA